LRIDDTDPVRSKKNTVDGLERRTDAGWACIGIALKRQSERLEKYTPPRDESAARSGASIEGVGNGPTELVISRRKKQTEHGQAAGSNDRVCAEPVGMREKAKLRDERRPGVWAARLDQERSNGRMASLGTFSD